MDLRALQKTIARGVYEIGCEDEFAQMVAKAQGWSGALANHRRRVWQSLSDNAQRNFDASWVLLAQRLFAYHDRADLCDEMVGAMMRAQWEGAQRHEDELVREMRMVRPQERRRDVG